MSLADAVTEGAQLFERLRVLPQLPASFKADRIDYEMGVQMVSVAVGGYLYLVSRPSLGSKFQCNLMGFLRGDSFQRREGLNVLVEIDSTYLFVRLFGRHKFQERILTLAVDTADKFTVTVRVIYFLPLCAVIDHALHSTHCLLLLLDIGHNRHQPLLAIRYTSS